MDPKSLVMSESLRLSFVDTEPHKLSVTSGAEVLDIKQSHSCEVLEGMQSENECCHPILIFMCYVSIHKLLLESSSVYVKWGQRGFFFYFVRDLIK